MSNVYLALYKGHGGNRWEKLTDWVIRKLTRGEYSHCEIVIEEQTNFTDRYRCDTVYECYTSSPRDGGVRCKQIDVTNTEKWDLILLNDVTANQIKACFDRTQGAKYDWWGALGVVLGIKQKRTQFFCSEWCFNAITGDDEGWRFSPNQMAAIFKRG